MLDTGLRELVDRDRALARLVARHGPPPLWARPGGFATLLRIILEQQVSLASARALYARLEQAVPEVTPETMLALGPTGLQQLGVTRQKARYVVALAERVTSGALPLRRLGSYPDEAASELLMRVPGIGPWTASIYLLIALRRPDIWPPGDLALQQALRRLRRLPSLPSPEGATRLAARWRPWRAVAARILWHAYLAERAGKSASTT